MPDWRESDELKDEIAEPKNGEGNPDPVVTAEAMKTVDERSPHRRKKHYQRVTTTKTKPSVNAGHGLAHLSAIWEWSNASQNITQNSITPSPHHSIIGLTNKSPMRVK